MEEARLGITSNSLDVGLYCDCCATLQEALPNVTKDDIINAMATAGLVGNVIKTNASISGAEVREMGSGFSLYLSYYVCR
jgi:hypothetical protein